MIKDAVLSPDGMYRYWLLRRWGGGFPLPIVMLNPSTADAEVDDPTIRRCMGFARGWGYDAIEVVNLFALRATNPAELAKSLDPVGPANNTYVELIAYKAQESGAPVLAAWGAHPMALLRGKDVVRRISKYGAAIECLGVTKDGRPRHPLYVSAAMARRALTLSSSHANQSATHKNGQRNE